MPRSYKKFTFIIVAVFLVGLIGGSFLVLKSATTKGALTRSTPLSQGKSSDELLAELLNLNSAEQNKTDEYVPPENKNLTEDFLAAVLKNKGLTDITAQEIASDDFFVSTILPYLKSNEPNLTPLIPDSVLKIAPSSSANISKYFTGTKPQISSLINVLDQVLKTDPEKLEDFATQNNLQDNIAALAGIFESLSQASIPKKYLVMHKNLLITVYSLQKIAESMANSSQDPLKSLLIMNQSEQAGEFWKNTLIEYDKAARIR